MSWRGRERAPNFFHLAVYGDSAVGRREIVELGADVDTHDGFGNTALHIGRRGKLLNIRHPANNVQILIDGGVSPDTINATDATALRFAARWNSWCRSVAPKRRSQLIHADKDDLMVLMLGAMSGRIGLSATRSSGWP